MSGLPGRGTRDSGANMAKLSLDHATHQLNGIGALAAAAMMAGTTDEWGNIAAKLEGGEPLDFEDGMRLYESCDIHTLGELANRLRERLHGRNAYYNTNLHINYTNYCVLRCKFC